MDEISASRDEFCPYVGLQPYREADQAYFFGRERDSRIISSNLYAAPLTILYGASGVGKSSVLRAGVMPRLRASPHTAVVIFDGWSDKALLNTLKTRCLEAIHLNPQWGDILVDISLPLDEFLFSLTRAFNGTLLIILDQFEEYFLYHPASGQDHLFDIEFARAVNREEIDANFMIALREDALSRLDRFRARIPNMLSNSLRLRHLDAASARDAMRKPLEVYARLHPEEPVMSIEDLLVEQLIQDIRVEKLTIGQGGQGIFEQTQGGDSAARIEAPFLQLVLTRLWYEELGRGSQTMRLSTLNDLGGAGRIVRTHMDAAMNALSPEEQDTAAGIFRYMVTPSGTKIAYTVADLEYYARPDRPLQPVLEKLAQGNVRIMRSVTSPGEAELLRYEIYHDVLAPAVLDWRARYEDSKQLLNVFHLLVEKGDTESALKVYQDIVQRTPQQAFFPERYEVRKILGESELGISCCVFDREQNRLLTATILDRSQAFSEADLAEFSSQMSKISSPRISRMLGFQRHRGDVYMLSEYVDGQPLRERLRPGKPLPYVESMSIARQVAEALEDGHRQGQPHLNLQPSNIVLGEAGIVLVSYGFSKLSRHTERRIDNNALDDYLAPEQLAGQVGSERSDLYALGTILYQMLTGHTPGVGRFYYPSEVNIEVTEAVDILIDHARERDPEKRFVTAHEMGMEIDRIALVSLEGKPNQYLRLALAWVSQRYERLASRKGFTFLSMGLAILLALSLIPSIPIAVALPARLLLPPILNSFLVSIVFDWVMRAFARRRGLGSLSTSGSGMGAILGFIFTLNLLRVLGLEEITTSPDTFIIFLVILAVMSFEVAFSLGIILGVAQISDRLFRSYTSGFYWSFVAIVVLEIILTIMGQPAGLIGSQG